MKKVITSGIVVCLLMSGCTGGNAEEPIVSQDSMQVGYLSESVKGIGLNGVIDSVNDLKTGLKSEFNKTFRAHVSTEINCHSGECSFSWVYTQNPVDTGLYHIRIDNIECTSCNFPDITKEDVPQFMNDKLQYIYIDGYTDFSENKYSMYYNDEKVEQGVDIDSFKNQILEKLTYSDTVDFDSYEGECYRASYDILNVVSPEILSLYNGGFDDLFNRKTEMDVTKSSNKKGVFKLGSYYYELSKNNNLWSFTSNINDVKSTVSFKVEYKKGSQQW